MSKKNILTCVYCGMAYPEGTPPYGSKVLTDHIKVCEKHPLRAAEDKIRRLRSALIGLVGISNIKELEKMREFLSVLPIPKTEYENMVNAIDAIISTQDAERE